MEAKPPPSDAPRPQPPASLLASIARGTIVAGFGRRWIFRGLDDDDRWRFLGEGERMRLPDPETGIPVHPEEDAVVAALRDGTLKIVKAVHPVRVRALARGRERTKAEVLAADPEAALRMAVCRRWDAARRSGDPTASMNAEAIASWLGREFAEDPLVAAFGPPSAGSVGRWLRERGDVGDRRWCDMESLKGQGSRRGRVTGLSYELAAWHATRAAVNPMTTCAAGWRGLRRDVRRARRGEPLKMDRFVPVEREASPVKEMDRTTFRKLFDSLATNANERARTSYDAVRSRRGGGGRSLEASRCWEVVEMDEKEVSAHLFVDERRRIPLGCGSTTIAVDRRSTAIVGWDVTWESPSTASAMRTLLHAGSLKEVPPDFAEDFPDHRFVAGKIGALIVDNASQYVGEAIEDVGGDVVMDVILAGVRKGTDKALVESRHDIVRGMVDDRLPSRKLPIAILREWNIDPSGLTATDMGTYRRRFGEMVTLYNVTRRADLGNRSPLEIMMEDRRLNGAPLPADLDQFRRAMSTHVMSRVLGGDGVVVNGLRYVRQHDHMGLLEDFVLASGDRRRTKRLRFDAKLKVDSSDLSRVWILNPRLQEYEELRCTKERYATGLSLGIHRIVMLGLPDAEPDEIHEGRLLEIRGLIEDRIEADHPEATGKLVRAQEQALSDPRMEAALRERASVEYRPASPTGAEAVPHALDLGRADAGRTASRLRRGAPGNDLDAAEDADRPAKEGPDSGSATSTRTVSRSEGAAEAFEPGRASPQRSEHADADGSEAGTGHGGKAEGAPIAVGRDDRLRPGEAEAGEVEGTDDADEDGEGPSSSFDFY